MTGKDIFKIWAPAGARWTDWVRPVPFVSMKGTFQTDTAYNFTVPPVNYISTRPADTAIIVDLPGYDSISEGLALTRFGFRPIPLYNGTNEQEGAMALVDNHMVERALIWGAAKLAELEIAPDALPAFLLDSNRTHRFKMNVSVFDNSWDLYDQDIPSAEYFLNHGIHNIIVRSEKIQDDLSKILYKFSGKGLKILFTKGYEAPKEVKVKKPGKRKVN